LAHGGGGHPWLPWSRASQPGGKDHGKPARRVVRAPLEFTRSSGRQGCRPPRQARMPDATTRATAPWRRPSLAAVEPGFPARRKRPWQTRAQDCSERHSKFHAAPGGKDAALHVRHGCLTLQPAQPRRGGGHPWLPWSRASQPGGKDHGKPARRVVRAPFEFPRSSGRQGCRPPRQARMPDATTRATAHSLAQPLCLVRPASYLPFRNCCLMRSRASPDSFSGADSVNWSWWLWAASRR